MIRKLKEAAPPSGFFEREPIRGAVRRRLPADLQAAAAIAYTYGWRMQSEVVALARRQLDLAGTLRLDPGTTKNDEGRIVTSPVSFKALLAAQIERVHRESWRPPRRCAEAHGHVSGHVGGRIS